MLSLGDIVETPLWPGTIVREATVGDPCATVDVKRGDGVVATFVAECVHLRVDFSVGEIIYFNNHDDAPSYGVIAQKTQLPWSITTYGLHLDDGRVLFAKSSWLRRLGCGLTLYCPFDTTDDYELIKGA